MRINRDFYARAEHERRWHLKNTWCSQCRLPDLGMVEPVEYEENGQIFIAGKCSKCGIEVTSELIEE